MIDSDDLSTIAKARCTRAFLPLRVALILALVFHQSMSAAHQEVVFQNGQFVVEEQSCAVDLMPDIETSKRVYSMLPEQFNRSLALHSADLPACASPSPPPRSDAVHREQLLQLLPQLNPCMTAQHFDQLMDQMFAGFKAGGDMGVMTCSQVLLLLLTIIALAFGCVR